MEIWVHPLLTWLWWVLTRPFVWFGRLCRILYRAIDARDCVALIGLALVAGGLYLVWVPAALIVPGCVLVWKALIDGHTRQDRSE